MHLFLRLGLSHFFALWSSLICETSQKGSFTRLRLHTLHFCLAAYTCRVRCHCQDQYDDAANRKIIGICLQKSYDILRTIQPKVACGVNAMQNLLSKSDVNQKSCQGPPTLEQGKNTVSRSSKTLAESRTTQRISKQLSF